ncbi:glycosyltransferase [Lunatibacter salilacus]|uniref:glycosyltransferase n=1 Tax=Lunatibacter salilacus TaxID=2483804 RepID=UPI00131C3CAC|nr:glycosyltransferase [Lunatibacter salilacus]
MRKIAIVYHYIALYRLPIFRELMNSEILDFVILSGQTSDISIEQVDIRYAQLPLKNGGLRWFFLKNIWLFKRKILWQSGLSRFVLANKFDTYIFLGNPYHLSTWVAAILARLLNRKVYFWMHGVYKDKLIFVDYIKLFFFYKIANGYFLYGNRAAQILKKYYVGSESNIHIIYNSLDYKTALSLRQKFSYISTVHFRAELFESSEIPTICFIGRLNKIKRIDMLIEAQYRLTQKLGNTAFNLLLIGDGEEYYNLHQKVKNLGLERAVYFTGALYDEEKIAKFLSFSDLCVNPGNVGLTAIHSLSYGTPVISHDNLNIQMPEVESILVGETGDLYQYNNLDSLINKIDKWFVKYPIKDELLINKCMSVVDRFYNPEYQRSIFESVLNNR